jgi:DNA-binding NtrC family response regulator
VKPYQEALREFKLRYWRHVLELAQGRVSEAARIAGCNRTAVYKMLDDLKLSPGGKTRHRGSWDRPLPP